ncbi:hypothetical protein MMC34_008407, partial [Xylographa carneopallida]|nr:hypothetical protein [Xylographa carneopallida]
AIVREVLEEVLPALLQQQQALMSSALNAIGSSAAVDSHSEDGVLSYGCRNCDTLQRQVEELQAEVVSLRSAALSSAAVASDSHRAVSPDIKEDGVARDGSPSPSNSDAADRPAHGDISTAPNHADNGADAQLMTDDQYSALEEPDADFDDDSQPTDESTSHNVKQSEVHASACSTTHPEQQQHTRASSNKDLTPEVARKCLWVQSRYNIHAAQLGEIMSHFGPVEEVIVPKPFAGNNPFAYVYFVHENDAAHVLKRAERKEFEHMIVRPYRRRARK